jgi:Tfp pilus assembly protein PilN
VSTQTVQTTGVVTMPSVNLMPPEIAEAARFRQVQMAMGGAVVLSMAVVGLLYTHAKSGVSSAQSAVNTAQDTHTSLQTKLSSLSTVQQTYDAVQAKQQLLQTAMGPEIRWSYILNDLSLRVPSNVWLNNVSATETAIGGTAAPSTSDPAAIGNITFAVTALKHDDIAAWLDSLAKEKGFTNASFSNSTEGAIGDRKVVTSSTSVDLDSTALSNRYLNTAGN